MTSMAKWRRWAKVSVVPVVALMAATGTARADDIYFHKADATWSLYETDVADCAHRTRHSLANVTDGSGVAAGGGPIGLLLERALTQIVAVVAERDQRMENIGYCMALRGWTVVSVDDLHDEARQAIDIDDFLDGRIKAWFAQPAPPVGKVVLRPADTLRDDAATPPPLTQEAVFAERIARRQHR